LLVAELVEPLERRLSEVERQLAADAARRWLTLEEAGERLGCSADAVRMRLKRGRLEARRQGRRVYVSAASVERV
jgi:excisionase family DNA binding protein